MLLLLHFSKESIFFDLTDVIINFITEKML